jgi:hypothetical protein
MFAHCSLNENVIMYFCRFQSIYNGTGVSHKVSKLVENRVYRFRICASNEAGQGPYSPMYEFKTDYAHPPPIKGKIQLKANSNLNLDFN